MTILLFFKTLKPFFERTFDFFRIVANFNSSNGKNNNASNKPREKGYLIFDIEKRSDKT